MNFSGEFGVRIDMRTRDGGRYMRRFLTCSSMQLPDVPCVLWLVFISLRPLARC